jgi:hypothetical protein
MDRTESSPPASNGHLAWLPVGLLVVIAVTHAYRVEVLDLTPWKGGGFGMFSTLDGRDNRRLIVSLVRRHGDETKLVGVELPTRGGLRQLAEKAQAMPTDERVRALADEIGKQPWRVANTPAPDGPNQARLVLDRAKQKKFSPVPFDAVEVSVWKLHFEHRGDRVSATPELLRTSYVEKPGASTRREARP